MIQKQEKKDAETKLNAWGHAYNDAYHYIIPLLLPFLRQEFSFSYFQSGLIITMHEALRSVFSLISGAIADRYNHKQLIIAFGFFLSSFLLGSVIYIRNLFSLILVLILMAIGVSTFHPLATALIGERKGSKKQGRDFGLFSAAGTLGLVIISFLFGWLVQFLGWRSTCLLLSVPGMILGWKYIRLGSKESQDKRSSGPVSYRSLFALFFLTRGIMCLGTKTILSFLTIYATVYIGLTTGASAWIISIYFLGVLIGSLFICRFIDNHNPLIFSIITTFVTSLLIYGLTYSKIPLMMGFLVACIGLMEGIYFPTQNTWLAQAEPNRTQGKLFGFGFFIEGFAATITPSVYGWLADRFDLLIAYRLATIPVFISFILYIILYHLSRRGIISKAKAF